MNEISLIRSSFIMVAAIGAVTVSKQQFFSSIAGDQVVPLVIRGFAGTIAFITLTLSLKNVPLSIFQCITNSLPFMVALLVFVWLRERISICELFAMVACFSGIVIVALNNSESEDSQVSEEDELSMYQFGILMAVVTTMMYAVAGVTTRRLRTVHFTVI